MNHQKTLLGLALAGVLGLPAGAGADTVTLSWTGAFTALNFTGQFTPNPDPNNCYPGMTVSPTSCLRTAISGSVTFDTVSGSVAGAVAPFSFFGSGIVMATSLGMQAIGNGTGGPGTLILGNMGLNWNGGNGIPLSIVWDAAGLYDAINSSPSVGQTITGGALPASNDTEFDSDGVPGGTTYPIGPALLATTTWNTTKVGIPVLGSNPSGTLPLVADSYVDITNGELGIGGSPMPTAPFPNYNFSFDIVSAEVTNIEAVPIPAAVWLFGSGLAGLAGIARRKRRR